MKMIMSKVVIMMIVVMIFKITLIIMMMIIIISITTMMTEKQNCEHFRCTFKRNSVKWKVCFVAVAEAWQFKSPVNTSLWRKPDWWKTEVDHFPILPQQNHQNHTHLCLNHISSILQIRWSSMVMQQDTCHQGRLHHGE